jgi:hypothetical protein
MSLDLALDETDCRYMVEELDRDIAEGRAYMSSRLSPAGAADFLNLLRAAGDKHDDTWLARQLDSSQRLVTHEMSQRGGVPYRKRVPRNAAETLAEGEFNRLYVRAQCLRALAEGRDSVEVFRAKAVADPRPESEARIGHRTDAGALLDDLRRHVGVDTALGVPGGPNSGLSAGNTHR